MTEKSWNVSRVKPGTNLLPGQKVNCHGALECYSISCPKKAKKG